MIPARMVALPILLLAANCTHLQNTEASSRAPGTEGAGSQPSSPHSPMTPYVWYEGEVEHRIWMDPGVIAELGEVSVASSVLGQASVLADVRSGGRVIRYWKLEQGSTAERALSRIKQDRTPGRFSPVLHDSPSPEGPVRLLPGNVVVILDSGWTKQAVADWVNRRSLRVVTELPFGPNMLLIETEAGLPALELANALHRSGEVKAAFPDWLAQKTPK